MKVNRVKNWGDFAVHMTEYIADRTVSKYGIRDGFDLMSVTDKRICIWNIIRYALRIWNGREKQNDLEKIAHYAEIAWSMDRSEKVGQDSN